MPSMSSLNPSTERYYNILPWLILWGESDIPVIQPTPMQMGFQSPASLSMEAIISFHDEIMFYLIFITVFVLYMLVRTVQIFKVHTLYNNRRIWGRYYAFLSHNVSLEIAWTLLPTLLLSQIMTASFSLLYALEEMHNPQITLKVIGHQWYWTYEVSHMFHKSLDSEGRF
jgi:cytochrome c oxidase subunit 2